VSDPRPAALRATHKWVALRAPRKLVAGLTLLVLSAFVLWAVGHLSQGTPQFLGPAMFPRWVAILVGLCGVVLVIISLARDGEAMDRWPWRGPQTWGRLPRW